MITRSIRFWSVILLCIILWFGMVGAVVVGLCLGALYLYSLVL